MKILILKPSSLGDVVQALPVLRLLKLHWPASEIYWWVDSRLAPLLEGDPDLAQVTGQPVRIADAQSRHPRRPRCAVRGTITNALKSVNEPDLQDSGFQLNHLMHRVGLAWQRVEAVEGAADRRAAIVWAGRDEDVTERRLADEDAVRGTVQRDAAREDEVGHPGAHVQPGDEPADRVLKSALPGRREQALTRQCRQGLADRRARYAQPLGETDFREPFSRGKVAPQDHFAQP